MLTPFFFTTIPIAAAITATVAAIIGISILLFDFSLSFSLFTLVVDDDADEVLVISAADVVSVVVTADDEVGLSVAFLVVFVTSLLPETDVVVVLFADVVVNTVVDAVVDAFVAVEDSRFFEHNGFDLPRFTKALLENIRTMSFGQGGSTFTMQLVKNTYFTNDDTGEEASRSGVSGVRRKVQEIALALELEKREKTEYGCRGGCCSR